MHAPHPLFDLLNRNNVYSNESKKYHRRTPNMNQSNNSFYKYIPNSVVSNNPNVPTIELYQY